MIKLEAFDAEELIALSRLDVEQSRLDQALGKLKDAVAREDCPREGLSLIARLYAQLRLTDKAGQYYRRYLELNPEAVTEHFQLGMIHFEQGKWEQALEIWSEVKEKEPLHPPALYFSALAKVELGQIAEGQRDIDVLLKAAPVDNLYYGRAKELLLAIERNQVRSEQPSQPPRVNPEEVYN